jgi:hypothetical protein
MDTSVKVTGVIEVTDQQPERENLQLTDEERELLRAELAALLPALSGERKEAYQALADAVERNACPARFAAFA